LKVPCNIIRITAMQTVLEGLGRQDAD